MLVKWNVIGKVKCKVYLSFNNNSFTMKTNRIAISDLKLMYKRKMVWFCNFLWLDLKYVKTA